MNSPKFGCGLLLVAAGVWAFWPTLVALVQAWSHEPDYSHGFLVPGIAAWILWMRKASAPAAEATLSWGGLVLFALSLLLHGLGAAWFLEALQGWALVVWIAALSWLLMGAAWLRWALPAIGFLFFMVPLPFRLEHSFSFPLQQAATQGSVWLLQLLGQPALAEGNVIILGPHTLEVADACAGLRIFMGVTAIAYAAAVFSSGGWLERAVLFTSALPAAIGANVLRITLTAIALNSLPSGYEAPVHDIAGWLMVPTAALLIGVFYCYLQCLFVNSTTVDVSDLMQRQRAS